MSFSYKSCKINLYPYLPARGCFRVFCLHLCTCRVCVCVSQDSGRLLYIGQNEWTHVNCALWSAEVFEDDDGSLKNVHMAVIRGKQLVRREGGREGGREGSQTPRILWG